MNERDEPEPTPAPSLDEIEARLQAALERARGTAQSQATDEHDADAARLERLEAQIDGGTGVQMPAVEETSLDSHMRDVEEKVRAVQQRKERLDAETDRIRRADQSSARGLGTGLAAAYALIGLPAAGAGIGLLLNKATGGNAWLPIFAILGMVAGIWWVMRLTNAQDRR